MPGARCWTGGTTKPRRTFGWRWSRRIWPGSPDWSGRLYVPEESLNNEVGQSCNGFSRLLHYNHRLKQQKGGDLVSNCSKPRLSGTVTRVSAFGEIYA